MRKYANHHVVFMLYKPEFSLSFWSDSAQPITSFTCSLARWLSGRASESGAGGPVFEPRSRPPYSVIEQDNSRGRRPQKLLY